MTADEKESAEDRAVREAWDEVDGALGRLSGLMVTQKGKDGVERALRARTVAELARGVPPLTMTAEREALVRKCLTAANRADYERDALNELDATRAALGAAREETRLAFAAAGAASFECGAARAECDRLRARVAEMEAEVDVWKAEHGKLLDQYQQSTSDHETALAGWKDHLLDAQRDLAALRAEHERTERALGDIVQRIDENPNETCPFCEPVQHDAGADHDEDCPITAAHAALSRRAALPATEKEPA